MEKCKGTFRTPPFIKMQLQTWIRNVCVFFLFVNERSDPACQPTKALESQSPKKTLNFLIFGAYPLSQIGWSIFTRKTDHKYIQIIPMSTKPNLFWFWVTMKCRAKNKRGYGRKNSGLSKYIGRKLEPTKIRYFCRIWLNIPVRNSDFVSIIWTIFL